MTLPKMGFQKAQMNLLGKITWEEPKMNLQLLTQVLVESVIEEVRCVSKEKALLLVLLPLMLL